LTLMTSARRGKVSSPMVLGSFPVFSTGSRGPGSGPQPERIDSLDEATAITAPPANSVTRKRNPTNTHGPTDRRLVRALLRAVDSGDTSSRKFSVEKSAGFVCGCAGAAKRRSSEADASESTGAAERAGAGAAVAEAAFSGAGDFCVLDSLGVVVVERFLT